MGETSYKSNRNLLGAKSIANFLAMNQNNMLYMTLSEYLMSLLKQGNLRRSDVVRDSGLEKAYIYQIFNGEKRPSRDKLIAITFGLHLPVEETQRTLKLGGYSELYARVARDAVILFAVSHGKDIWETDSLLHDNGFPTLLALDK